MMTIPDFAGLAIPPSIYAERDRQQRAEGWTPAHDDSHADGSMLAAARVYWIHAVNPYALPSRTEKVRAVRMVPAARPEGRFITRSPLVSVKVPAAWPWTVEWWKPKTPRRDLERAGALCLAEAERLRRADPDCSLEEVGNMLRAVVTALATQPPEGA